MSEWQMNLISFYIMILLLLFFLFSMHIVLDKYLFKLPMTMYSGVFLLLMQFMMNLNVLSMIFNMLYFYENEMYEMIWFYFLFIWFNLLFMQKMYSWMSKIDKEASEENFVVTGKFMMKFSIFLLLYWYMCVFDIQLDWENKLELFFSFYLFVFFIDVLMVYNIFSTNSTVYSRMLLFFLYLITLYNTWLIMDFIWSEVYEHYIWESLYLYFLFVMFNMLFQWFLMWNMASPGHMPYTKIHKFMMYCMLVVFQWMYFLSYSMLVYLNSLFYMTLLMMFMCIFDLDKKMYMFILPYMNMYMYLFYLYVFILISLVTTKFMYSNAYVKSWSEDKYGNIFFHMLFFVMSFYVYMFYNYGDFMLNLTMMDFGMGLDYFEYLLMELYKISMMCYKYFIWFLLKVFEVLEIIYDLIMKGKY